MEYNSQVEESSYYNVTLRQSLCNGLSFNGKLKFHYVTASTILIKFVHQWQVTADDQACVGLKLLLFPLVKVMPPGLLTEASKCLFFNMLEPFKYSQD